MDLNLYKVKVPGSLMLFGEHAVLHQKQAIVTAINYYIKVSLTPRLDRQIKIISSNFGELSLSLHNFKIIKPYEYVLTSIEQSLPKIKNGFELRIDADFSSTIGFGSSAAVTVATVGVLTYWLSQKKPNLKQLYRQAIAVVRLVQGFGSGADVAASVLGGIIAYKVQPLTIKKLPGDLPLLAVYSGSKIKTAKVVAQVEQDYKQLPVVFRHLYEVIDCVAKEAVSAIKNKKWALLGKLMNIHQGLHEALGVNNGVLAELIFTLRQHPKIYGAKISGAGLGDCVIGLAKKRRINFKEKIEKNKIDVAVSQMGIVFYEA